MSGATHRHGHTLDVVVTRGDLPSTTVDVRPSGEYSDHSLILFQLQLPHPPLRFVDVNTRAWKGFDADHFHDDLLSSPLCSQSLELEHLSADELQELYDSSMSSLLDKHAPRVTRRRHQPTTPWFEYLYFAITLMLTVLQPSGESECLSVDIVVRWLLPTATLGSLRYVRSIGYIPESRTSTGKPRLRTVTVIHVSCGPINLTSVFRRRKSRISITDGLDAEHFLKAFAAKIDGVRSSTASDPLFTDLNTDVALHVFESVDAMTVLRLVNQAPNKNCELDPVPTWLVKHFSGDLSPFIARLFNASFRDGVFPTSQKCAVVTCTGAQEVYT